MGAVAAVAAARCVRAAPAGVAAAVVDGVPAARALLPVRRPGHRPVPARRGAPPAGGRGAGGGGRGGGGAAPLTGTFTVRLTVGGETYQQPLVVRAEPRGR